MTLTPGHFPNEQRTALRAVALAYRRAYRAGGGQGGCYDAALREYRRLCPDGPTDQRAASREVNRMGAPAISTASVSFGMMAPKKSRLLIIIEDRKMARIRTTPGEVLREEFMVPLGLSANALAIALRVPATRIGDILRPENPRAITAETAIR